MPPPLPVIQCHSAEAKSGKEGLMESLKKTSALQNLSRSQLEEIVAQVVREDGFVTLVCPTAILVSFSDFTPYSWLHWIRCGRSKDI